MEVCHLPQFLNCVIAINNASSKITNCQAPELVVIMRSIWMQIVKDV